MCIYPRTQNLLQIKQDMDQDGNPRDYEVDRDDDEDDDGDDVFEVEKIVQERKTEAVASIVVRDNHNLNIYRLGTFARRVRPR